MIEKELYETAFYNWLLIHGVDPIVSQDMMFSSVLPETINADVAMHKLKAGIEAYIQTSYVSKESIKEALPKKKAPIDNSPYGQGFADGRLQVIEAFTRALGLSV